MLGLGLALIPQPLLPGGEGGLASKSFSPRGYDFWVKLEGSYIDPPRQFLEAALTGKILTLDGIWRSDAGLMA